jgi:hypothetical protein
MTERCACPPLTAAPRPRLGPVRPADLDESPMVYRRLPEVLAHHAGSVRVLHMLRPFAAAMAGEGEFDCARRDRL